jgi:hypothetical protein
MPHERLVESQSLFDSELKNLDQLQQSKSDLPYPTFYDDFLLARFFKGISSREIAMPKSKLHIPEEEFVKRVITPDMKESLQYAQRQLEYIPLDSDHICLDHWMLPYARYECGNLHVRLGQYEKAREEFKAALNGGYKEDEYGQQKKKVSMEQTLQLQVHNALGKLKIFEQSSPQNSAHDDEEMSD